MLQKNKYFNLYIILILLLTQSVITGIHASNITTKSHLRAPDGISYKWTFNGEIIDGVNDQELIYMQNGSYTVEVTDAEGNTTTQSYVVNGMNSAKTVYVIGDSTASIYDSDLYPRTGWAQVLQPFFISNNILIDDHAASGRSSKSFYDEGRWTTVYNQLSTGDYVFIQFAHNDEKDSDPDRYTEPSTTYKDYLKIYINGSLEKGAYPVLISSIPRNYWSGSTMRQSHNEYTQAMKEVAEELSVPFIDMEASARAFLTPKGQSYSTDSIYLNLDASVWENYLDGRSDNTHLQEKGAYELCKVLISDLNQSTDTEVINLVSNLESAAHISAVASPALKGKLAGYGVYTNGSSVTLTATPTANYRFVKWALKGSDLAYSTNPTINLTTDSTSMAFIAYFESMVQVGETQINNSIKVYPNPTNDLLYVEIDSDNYSIDLYNQDGQLVKSKKNVNSIITSSLPSGSYILKISSDQENYSRKIQVRH